MTLAIEAVHLTKRYGVRTGVEDLTFAVRTGEVFGFLGPNGAGKTTTIRTLLDFIRPTQGRIGAFGLDSRADGLEIRRRTGYLPGDLSLYERSTGEEMLSFLVSLRPGVPRQSIPELAERLGADLMRPIRSLSHGNKQKIGLIFAFMHHPDLLVLDEPTLGLDPLVQHEFRALLAEATADGRTVFLSSHDLAEVEQTCDRVAMVREGCLVAVEDIGTLKARTRRSVEIHFDRPVPLESFADLPGIAEVVAAGDAIRCVATGSLDALVKMAGKFTVVNISTHEPGLEETFMSFYGGDGARRAVPQDVA